MIRRPVWCHYCGAYTFLDEWGETAYALDGHPDICPACGNTEPPLLGPLLGRGDFLSAVRAAEQRAVVWS